MLRIAPLFQPPLTANRHGHVSFKCRCTKLTVIIDKSYNYDYPDNQLFNAANLFLGTKELPPTTHKIQVGKLENENDFTITLDRDQRITDVFKRVECKWVLRTEEETEDYYEREFFELSFEKKHKEMVLNEYLPYILEKAKEIEEQKKVVELHRSNRYIGNQWTPVVMNHPATFETIAMDEDKKAEILEDLNLFMSRKEYYRSVGKAWRRGYLVYGPPGTGKSSMVAAMANYLKFDVYHLENQQMYENNDLRRLFENNDLRRLFKEIKKGSIIVIEDIDSTLGLKNVSNDEYQVRLSLVLDFFYGLWSSCGDEWIIVFTTSHKECLNATLLRPGRMDVHIKMSYCTYNGFKMLASTYLQAREEDNFKVFGDIKEALKKIKVTPAEITGWLMKSENVDIVLENLVQWLQKKGEQMEIDLT